MSSRAEKNITGERYKRRHFVQSRLIGDNYFSRLTTIIFTVFFKKINGLTQLYLLTSSGHLLTHMSPLRNSKSLSNLAFNKVSFGSLPWLRQSFAWASGKFVIFKISFPHIPTAKAWHPKELSLPLSWLPAVLSSFWTQLQNLLAVYPREEEQYFSG